MLRDVSCECSSTLLGYPRLKFPSLDRSHYYTRAFRDHGSRMRRLYNLASSFQLELQKKGHYVQLHADRQTYVLHFQPCRVVQRRLSSSDYQKTRSTLVVNISLSTSIVLKEVAEVAFAFRMLREFLSFGHF